MAQPLCLNGTIWDAEEEACVELVSSTPTDEATDPTPVPTEPEVAEPTPTQPADTGVDDADEDTTASDDEATEDEDAPDAAG